MCTDFFVSILLRTRLRCTFELKYEEYLPGRLFQVHIPPAIEELVPEFTFTIKCSDKVLRHFTLLTKLKTKTGKLNTEPLVVCVQCEVTS